MSIKRYANLQDTLNKLFNESLKIEYIHGYLTAIACSPSAIDSADWFPSLFTLDNKKVYDTYADAAGVMPLFIEIFDDINTAFVSRQFHIFNTLLEESISEDTGKIWAKGFTHGLSLWKKSFSSDITEFQLFLPILLLADNNSVAEMMRGGGSSSSISKIEETLRVDFLPNISKLVLKIWEYTHNLNKSMPATPLKEKVGRNDLCPCGSGKKYKKCCGK